MKCGAIIQVGWRKEFYNGRSPKEIVKKLEEDQDLDCLVMMGRMEEDDAGQLGLNKHQEFIEKYRYGKLSISDIKDLNVHLSVGDLVCYGVAEGDEAVAELKKEL